MTLAERIDKLYNDSQVRLTLQKQVDVMKVSEDELKHGIIAELTELGEDSEVGYLAKFTLAYKEEPEVVDWAAFQTHIRTTGELDLLQKRPMVSAIKQRWEEGTSVPGIMKLETITGSLKKVA